MSGYKMIKRTKGVNEFEFLALEDGLKLIAENKEKRRLARRRRWKKEARERKEKELEEERLQKLAEDQRRDPAAHYFTERPNTSGNKPDFEITTTMWEAKEDDDDEVIDDKSPEIVFVKDNTLKPRQTNVIITVTGWLAAGKDDYTNPFSTIFPNMYGDQYTLVWESEALKELGSSLTLIAGEVTSFIVQQGLQATLLPVLMAGLAAPLWAFKLNYFLDNPWGNCLDKAKKVGKVHQSSK
jgi:hypothetical protein